MLDLGRPVLLVDDDPDDRFLFEQAWKDAGLTNPLITLTDGRGARDFLEGCPPKDMPALIILDIKMPGLDGLELLEAIRGHQRLRSTPVIVLTASTSPKDVSKAYALGVNSFFVKPASLGELSDMLRALGSCWFRYNEFPAPPDGAP